MERINTFLCHIHSGDLTKIRKYCQKKSIAVEGVFDYIYQNHGNIFTDPNIQFRETILYRKELFQNRNNKISITSEFVDEYMYSIREIDYFQKLDKVEDCIVVYILCALNNLDKFSSRTDSSSGYRENPFYRQDLSREVRQAKIRMAEICIDLTSINNEEYAEQRNKLISFLNFLIILLGEGLDNPPREILDEVPKETRRLSEKLKGAAGVSKSLSDASLGIIEILNSLRL